MIFQQYRGHLLVVRQPDHGVQTGLFGRHWGNEQTPPFTPREPVIAAGTRHDDGWKAWEERPSLDPSTGQPWQFYRLTPHEHVPLYRRGIALAAQHDPTTGLLVSMHGAGLYNDRYGAARLAERQFSPSEQALVDEFLAERVLGHQRHTHVTTDPQVWYNYLLLEVWDRLSLQYAFRLAADGIIAPLPRPDGAAAALHCRHNGDLALLLDPYPFEQSPCTFPLQARLLPDKPYRNAEEFLAEMAKADVTVLECRARRD
jgi:Protein of unknown function (DUF3891)